MAAAVALSVLMMCVTAYLITSLVLRYQADAVRESRELTAASDAMSDRIAAVEASCTQIQDRVGALELKSSLSPQRR